MIPRQTRQFLAAVSVTVAAIVATSCEKVPLLAPTGSAITLTTPTTALSANGSATIVAQVLESSGTPPHSGTRVTFMTTLGVVEPSETSTDASGRAVVTFRANGASGIAEISASSGGATTSGGSAGTSTTTTTTSTTTTPATGSGSSNRNLTIYVGTAAVGRVLLVAAPAILPTAGGTTTVTANVLDRNGNALAAAPVTFSTTAGTMSASVVNTDASGNAVAALTTFQSATVTATVGLSSTSGSGSGSGGASGGTAAPSTNQASVTVSLTSAPTLSITPPATPPSAGLPSTFTFKVTPASTGSTTGSDGKTTSTGAIPIRELVIDWGDGSRDNLGAVSGDQIVAHTYRSAGSYSVTATVTDVAGGTARVATVVSVIAVPRPTIIVTPTPQSAPSGSTINVRIEIVAPSGLAISSVVVDFGDTQSQSLGGATGVILVPHVYTAPAGTSRTYNLLVSVTDSSGQTTIGSSVVSITGATP